MAQYTLRSLRQYLGLTTDELEQRLSALQPLIVKTPEGFIPSSPYLDDYVVRLLFCLDRLLAEDKEVMKVGRAAHT